MRSICRCFVFRVRRPGCRQRSTRRHSSSTHGPCMTPPRWFYGFYYQWVRSVWFVRISAVLNSEDCPGSGVAPAVRARPRGLCHVKLGIGISKYDLLGHASHTRWLHRSVCISRTMCTNPQENAETAAARMQWRLGSGRPGLPARISAVHAYVHGSDCSD